MVQMGVSGTLPVDRVNSRHAVSLSRVCTASRHGKGTARLTLEVHCNVAVDELGPIQNNAEAGELRRGFKLRLRAAKRQVVVAVRLLRIVVRPDLVQPQDNGLIILIRVRLIVGKHGARTSYKGHRTSHQPPVHAGGPWHHAPRH